MVANNESEELLACRSRDDDIHYGWHERLVVKNPTRKIDIANGCRFLNCVEIQLKLHLLEIGIYLLAIWHQNVSPWLIILGEIL